MAWQLITRVYIYIQAPGLRRLKATDRGKKPERYKAARITFYLLFLLSPCPPGEMLE